MDIVNVRTIVPATPAYALRAGLENDQLDPKSPLLMHATQNAASGGKDYYAILRNEIGEPHHYLNLIDVVRSMRPIDQMDLTIISPGGYVWTGIAIINAMLQSKGTITTTASGEIASMGAFIWAYGTQLKMDPNAHVMFHMTSHADANNSSLVLDRAMCTIDYCNYLLTDIKQRGLLTDEEIAAINDARDCYLDYNTMAPRIEQYNQERRVSDV